MAKRQKKLKITFKKVKDNTGKIVTHIQANGHIIGVIYPPDYYFEGYLAGKFSVTLSVTFIGEPSNKTLVLKWESDKEARDYIKENMEEIRKTSVICFNNPIRDPDELSY